jgi:hypothetical protein
MSKTAFDMDNLMYCPSQRNKLSGSVIISFVCCLLFAQSILARGTDKRTLVKQQAYYNRPIEYSMLRSADRHVRDLLRADWLDYVQLGHDWQTKFKHV